MSTTAKKLPKLAVDETQVSNGAEAVIVQGQPYRLRVSIVGTAPLLFHAWNVEAVKEKASAAKGSEAKKTDNIESYVYRTDDGHLGVPGPNFTACLHMAAKFRQDPRSPRKSAFDICKAGVLPLDIVAPFEPETKVWEYEDARRVTINRAGVTRIRPAMREGWRISFLLLVSLPQYWPLPTMSELVTDAGRLIGLCDFRPTYGRFAVESMEVLTV